jgi:hypothetical protein
MGVIWTDTLFFRPGDNVPKPKAFEALGGGYEETLLPSICYADGSHAPWSFQASTEEIEMPHDFTSNELPLI